MTNRTYFTLITCLVLIFISLSFLVMSGYTQSFDVAFCEVVYNTRTEFRNLLMFGISWIASTTGVTMIALTLVLLLVFKKRYNFAIFIAVVNGVSPLINKILKETFERPRPTMSPMEMYNSFSFPSGHSQAAFVVFASVIFVVAVLCPRYLKISIWISTTLVLLIGFSRVYLGVHYPTDVLAGFLIGAAWFITAQYFFERFNFLEFPQVAT